MKQIGLYIHIPFCKQKCNYCDFTSFANKENMKEAYIESLINEIRQEANKEFIIDTIYIGGGTPSYIGSQNIVKIIQTIKQNYNITQNVEITIEVNPGTVDKEKLINYINCGINRISIGLQTADNNLLKTIGRMHTYEQFLNTYKLVRQVGFKNINVDLMLGLPNQGMQILEDTVYEILKLQPMHISVYSLILEEGTKMYNQVQSGKLSLPSDKMERKMYWKVKEKLEQNEYNHYEISNFAKKGYESKHNLNCWEQRQYIGVGLAAHSYIDMKRYSNTQNIEKYIENYKIYQQLHEVQTLEDMQKEYMMLGLRKIEGVDIQKFKNKFADNPLYIFRKEIDKLVNEGLIEVELNNIKLTNKGIDLANLVWQEFI